MGVVYRARDPFINRLVALKTITTGVADDPALLQRFHREAQSAGGLQHPNIVTIYDLGEAGALPYIAMELVEGENLEQVIARRSVLPLSLKLMYAMQACRAFDYAHKRGIVHRDIKPGNVMVNKEGTVKVVDFGIARVLETSRTQTGMLIGTFAYMSPEQYHGEHADERSDIWSFGVLLYELLSYQRPFAGPTPASLMHSICDEEPAPLAKAVPDCPRELELVVARMLRKSPLERYQSMEDVLLDLDPVYKALQSQSVTEILQQVRKLFDEGPFAEGRDLVRQALQVDSGNQQARSLLEKANAELKRIHNRPKAQQYVDKGQTLLAEGKLQEARIAAASALQLDSNFAPAEDLRKAIEQELNRVRLISEWLESAKQNLAEGLPDEAQALLAKVLEAEPSHAQAQSLQQQVLKEKAEREKSRRLREGLQRAREFWTQQNHDECLNILRSLDNEFPGEEEVLRLTEAVCDDQLEQKKQQGLLQSRNLLAASRHDDAIALLSGLQNQFPNDDEIPLLIEDVRRDQLNQRRLLGLDEARSLLAAGNYDASISLLANLRQVFPADQEIPELLETAQQGQAEQVRQRGLAQARQLLSARQYKECIASLAALEKQFPRNEEILALQKSVHDQQLQQEKEQKLEQARNLLTARRYHECSALLATLEKQFPGDAEILRIQNALRDDQSKQRKLQALEQARKLLSSKNYENCVALLTSLHTEFADDQEIPKLLESARKEQVDERKRVAVADARNLLAARNYQQAVAFLNKLQSEFQNDTAIAKLLESARKEQADQRQREGLAEARKLLAARRYDESIVLLGKLAAEFPDESDITKLLATAREDLAERQKQQKLAEAKNLLAAQSFDQALSILDQLATAHSKDSAVTKLHALVQREQEKHTKAETIQRELDALKKLMGDKKYPEVIARTKELLQQFPAEPNFTRLAEFAASRQASIENDLLLQKVLGEVQTLFNAGRFEECVRSAQSGQRPLRLSGTFVPPG